MSFADETMEPALSSISNHGISSIALIAIILVVAGVAMVVAFLGLRRRRRPDQIGAEAEEPPTEPPGI
jgi:hypothetical protein